MRKNIVRFLSVICAAALTAGCQPEDGIRQTAQMQSGEASGIKDVTDSSKPAEEEKAEPEEAAEETAVEYRVMDIMDQVASESEVDTSREDMRRIEWASDVPPVNTVEFTDSYRQEIIKTWYTQSVVDENDPDTYQIVREEQKVQTTEEIPVEYVNSLGDVKYAYIDGVWYEYRYTNSEITLDKMDEKLALTLLNWDGSFNGYDIVHVECTEVSDGSLATKYKYNILYRRASAMEQAPADVENLTVSNSRKETVTTIVTVEKKVPVPVKRETGTGEYILYGWQTVDGNTYYYDKNGNKVTGLHTIRGIRYMFNEDGVCTSRSGVTVSSQNGRTDWERVRNAGIDFAYIRCGYRGYTEGRLILDSGLERNMSGARAAGIGTGIYLFSQAVSEREAVEEASLAVTLAKKYQIDRPIVLDVSYATPECSGRADGLSIADRTACISAFCRTVQNAGYTPMIHAEKDWMDSCLDMAALKDFPLWLAQYNTNVTYTGPYEIWQYTAKGTIDGISGNVGLNIIYGK